MQQANVRIKSQFRIEQDNKHDLLLQQLRRALVDMDSTNTACKILVKLGKCNRYFDTREEAKAALNAYNVKRGLPLFR